MSFFGVQEIIENCNYLNALNEEKGASTEILAHLLPYDDPKVRALEDRLRNKDALSFDTIFSEPTGFYLLQRFLLETSGLDKLLFLKDVDAYNHMRFENARQKVARLVFDRYLLFSEKPKPKVTEPKLKKGKKEDEEDQVHEEIRASVFDAIKRRNQERRLDGKANSLSASNSRDPAASASLSAENVVSRAATAVDQLKRADTKSDADSKVLSAAVLAGLNTPRAVGLGHQDDEDGAETVDGTLDPDSTNTNATTDPGTPTGNATSRFPVEKKDTSIEEKENSQLSTGSGKGKRSGTSSAATPSTPAVPVPQSDAKRRTETKGEDAEMVRMNCIGVIEESVQKVARFLEANQAPKNLFKPIAEEVREVLIRERFQDFQRSLYYKKYIQTKILEEAHVGPEDFATMRLLGRGGFGTVYACRKIDSGKLYAMKAINKKLIKGKKAVAMTMLERHTLSLVQSKFVCTLAYAFQDKTHLFLIMDLMAGGDLKFHLTKNRNGAAQGFSEARARFHAAEILLGLEAMHAKNIIFRDLKLENVLLDEEGHCKISDLGLVALYGQKKVNHYAGTPGYIAPEVTQKKPYGPAVDIFSYGVTLYRMLSGKKPFRGHTRQDFDKAVCNDEPVYDPDIFSPTAISLLKGLLEKDPKKRLGCGKGGTQAIKDHPFFASIDWGLLEIGYLDPPFTPSKHDVNANSLEDIGFEDQDAKQYEKVVLDEKFRKQIHGFDYVSKHAVRLEIVAALKRQWEEEETKKAAKRAKARQAATNQCCIIL